MIQAISLIFLACVYHNDERIFLRKKNVLQSAHILHTKTARNLTRQLQL